MMSTRSNAQGSLFHNADASFSPCGKWRYLLSR